MKTIFVVNWRAQLYEFRFHTNTRSVSGGIVPIVPQTTIGSHHASSTYVVGTPIGFLLVKRQLDIQYNGIIKDDY